MGEQKRASGRPPKLDGKLAVEVAALLIAGNSTTEIAQTLGVSRRSICAWRQRAWSRDPRDVACVALEQMIQRGKLAAAEAGQGIERRVTLDATLRPIAAVFADLEHDFDRSEHELL